jgi:predicted 3-demethylubiquinone-9 3-methyltransferase (glyoxalase superfamily)
MHDKITPCFWFDGKADEAVNLYTSLFADSRVVTTSRYGDGGPMPAGTVMTISFELAKRPFMALNGGPQFQFTPAISMMVACDTQEEIDNLWDKLSQGGQTQQCGWLTDRFGLSWQIVPSILPELMAGDAEQSNRVMQALWGMVKLDIAALERAAGGS